VTHSEGSVPSPKPQAVTVFKPESGQDNQHNQNTFQAFHENWILCVHLFQNYHNFSVTLHHAYCQCWECLDRKERWMNE